MGTVLDKVDAQLLASSKEKYALRMKAAEECSSNTVDSDYDCDCDSGHAVSPYVFPDTEEMKDAYLKLASHRNVEDMRHIGWQLEVATLGLHVLMINFVFGSLHCFLTFSFYSIGL